MALLSDTQRRYRILFENHVDTKTGDIFDKEFERDILKLRLLGADMLKKDRPGVMMSAPLRRFILKYEFPYLMRDFLYIYAHEGTIDFQLIGSGMLLVSEADKVAVGSRADESKAYRSYKDTRSKHGDDDLKLVLNPNSTKKEAMQFLDMHWDSFVKPRRSKSFLYGLSERVREQYNAKRDYRVLELLEDYKPKDVSIMISKEYPGYTPTYVDFAKIKKRRKPKKITI